jgi:histidinol-phosphate aminotransferase
MEATRRVTDEGRNFLQAEFLDMDLEFVPSHANFVLVRVGDGKKVFEALLRRGIIVRAMGSYGLPEWIRVSVGTMPQNTAFVAELRDLDREGLLGRGTLAKVS